MHLLHDFSGSRTYTQIAAFIPLKAAMPYTFNLYNCINFMVAISIFSFIINGISCNGTAKGIAQRMQRH